MAELPDIDTTEVGFMAYWNAIDDGGASSIDPEDVLNSGNISSSVVYDNGIEADYLILDEDASNTTGRAITVRAKSDGWIVAYMDRTNVEQPSTSWGTDHSNVASYVDIVSGWTVGGTYGDTSTLLDNTLFSAIEDLYNNLGNSGSISFSKSSIGIYNYEHSDATTISLLYNSIQDFDEMAFTVTEGTNINYIRAASSNDEDTVESLDLNGVSVISGDGPGSRSVDISQDINSLGVSNSVSTDYYNNGVILTIFS